MSDRPAIAITENEFDRLSTILESQPKESPVVVGLLEELDRAVLVPARELPENVVGMNSRVRFQNEGSGKEYELKLVYPAESGAENCVSILAPAGAAMLGLSVGDRIDWPVSRKENLRLKIIHVAPAT